LRRFLLEKRPPIQRAERWSLSAESEIPYRSKAPQKGEFQKHVGLLKEGKRTSGGFPYLYTRYLFPINQNLKIVDHSKRRTKNA
jgi:hypothetical protein